MLTAARKGGTALCMIACLPCMISYSWLFREIVTENPESVSSEFGRLIKDYANEEYAQLCHEWAAFTDTLCDSLSDAEKAECREVFRKCSLHEYDFWLMSSVGRDDL